MDTNGSYRVWLVLAFFAIAAVHGSLVKRRGRQDDLGLPIDDGEDSSDTVVVRAAEIQQGKVNYDGCQVWRLQAAGENSDLVSQLEDSGDVSMWAGNSSAVDVLVRPETIPKVSRVLRERNVNFDVVIPDLQKAIEEENPILTEEEMEELQGRKARHAWWQVAHSRRRYPQGRGSRPPASRIRSSRPKQPFGYRANRGEGDCIDNYGTNGGGISTNSSIKNGEKWIDIFIMPDEGVCKNKSPINDKDQSSVIYDKSDNEGREHKLTITQIEDKSDVEKILGSGNLENLMIDLLKDYPAKVLQKGNDYYDDEDDDYYEDDDYGDYENPWDVNLDFVVKPVEATTTTAKTPASGGSSISIEVDITYDPSSNYSDIFHDIFDYFWQSDEEYDYADLYDDLPEYEEYEYEDDYDDDDDDEYDEDDDDDEDDEDDDDDDDEYDEDDEDDDDDDDDDENNDDEDKFHFLKLDLNEYPDYLEEYYGYDGNDQIGNYDYRKGSLSDYIDSSDIEDSSSVDSEGHVIGGNSDNSESKFQSKEVPVRADDEERDDADSVGDSVKPIVIDAVSAHDEDEDTHSSWSVDTDEEKLPSNAEMISEFMGDETVHGDDDANDNIDDDEDTAADEHDDFVRVDAETASNYEELFVDDEKLHRDENTYDEHQQDELDEDDEEEEDARDVAVDFNAGDAGGLGDEQSGKIYSAYDDEKPPYDKETPDEEKPPDEEGTKNARILSINYDPIFHQIISVVPSNVEDDDSNHYEHENPYDPLDDFISAAHPVLPGSLDEHYEPDYASVSEIPEQVYEMNESTSTRMPDVSTITKMSDGSTTTKMPDGSTTTKMADVFTTTEMPYWSTTIGKTEGYTIISFTGSTTTEKLHESTITKKPDGYTTTEKLHESTTTKQPDGYTTTEKLHESTTTKKPEAYTTTEKLHESTTTRKPEAYTTTEKLDWSTITKIPTETSTTTGKPVGSTTTKKSDESTTTEMPDKPVDPHGLEDADVSAKPDESDKPVYVDMVELDTPGHRMEWTSYHPWEDIEGYLDYLAQTYPDICSVRTIGKSIEGRNLKVLRISNGKEGVPALWIDGGIHAREWIAHAAVTYVINYLVENSDKLVADYYILPVVNPDGYVYTWEHDRLWRKNRKNPEKGRCAGVDLNRNFGYRWGGLGSSKNPCREDYGGSGPFSEPETNAVRNFFESSAANFQAFLTFHSYGQYILYPWGYDRRVPPDYAELDKLGRMAAAAMKNADSEASSYTVGNSAYTLYPASGGADDWAKAMQRIKYAYTIELRDTGKHGFILPARHIVPVANEALAFVKVVADACQNRTSRLRGI